MIKVLFICHGNICRSPMAQFVFQSLACQAGLEDQIFVDSAATSTEEIGNPVHRGTRRILQEKGIPMKDHRAVQLTRSDGKRYDYLVGMDSWNMRNMARILGENSRGEQLRLLDLTEEARDVADPWYTGDFEKTYQDIDAGCRALLDKICRDHRLYIKS